ncbi:MAG: nucleotidyltransferase domain-containing protein [Defluviitaleaceae bacterium]|nr:nucleotidyltransferase domain-containing protein [Defluviitaleaceae bacterium]
MVDKTRAKEIAQNYSKEVIKVLSPDKIILFGSYANGVPHTESDIDIAVLVKDLHGKEWYNARILLQKIIRKKDFFDIEPHLLDETQDPSGFAEHVIKTGELIYSQ